MSNINQIIKIILLTIAIAIAIYLISLIIEQIELIIGAVLASLGILSIIWTLLARSNLSPKSILRFFTNTFLACSIAVLVVTIVLTIDTVTKIKEFIYIEYLMIFITYFFFILVSYYIYKIGREFGFQNESIEIKKRLKQVKKPTRQ